MRYSQDVIEEVRSRNNIVDIIGEYVKLKKTGSRYTGLCPFHTEKTPSFSVDADKQLYYCFGCHASGDVFRFVQNYQNATFTEAVRMLADRAGIAVPEETLSAAKRKEEEEKQNILLLCKEAAKYYYYALGSGEGKTGKAYLKKRGLTDETIRKFGLGYAGKTSTGLYKYLKTKEFSDRLLTDSGLFKYNEKYGFSGLFWNRVMFPIFDARGRVIGFGGRVMGDAKPKYLNSPDSAIFNKRLNLYGLHIARSAAKERILLCEGYMDVISMHQAGFANAVASLGTALTPEQARLISRFTGEVVLMYDSDGAGVNAALRAIPILRDAGLSAKVASLSPCKDPDEFVQKYGTEALRERISAAENGFLFSCRQMEKRYDINDPAAKTKFEHALARRLLTFPDEIERGNYLDAVCRQFRIPKESMRRLVAKLAAVDLPAEEKEEEKAPAVRVRTKEDPGVLTEKRLLNFFTEDPGYYMAVKDRIRADDFTDPVMRRAAEEIIRQIENGKIDPPAVTALFDSEEDEKKAAALFFENDAPKEQGRDEAFTETVIRMLRIRNRRRTDGWNGDPVVFGELLKERKELDEMQRGGVVLHPVKIH